MEGFTIPGGNSWTGPWPGNARTREFEVLMVPRDLVTELEEHLKNSIEFRAATLLTKLKEREP
jgi:hypothetical protein